MESQYTKLKRDTLKDLLETRGRSAGCKSKAVLIAELMEGDRARAQEGEPAAGGAPLTDLQRDIQWRLALYGTTPSPEIITQIISEVTNLRLAEVQQANGRPVAVSQGSRKKLPYAAFRNFQDGEEDIDKYLQVFETQCDLQGVDAADWVTILISKLSGRALDAFEATPAEDRKDYERVKERILARYNITPEAHRLKFRGLRKKEGQPYTELAHQMSRSAEAWFRGCQATTMAEVVQLVLLEQFYDQLLPEIRDWVKDRKPLTVDEAAVLADQYLDARRVHRPDHRPLQSTPQAPVSRTPPPYPSLQPVPAPVPRKSGPRCYGCDQVGHIKSNCPRNSQSSQRNRASAGPWRAAAHCLDTSPGATGGRWDEEEFDVLHEVDPVQAAAMDNRQHHCQPVRVNGRATQGLRDSRATITLVQPRMVTSEERTGRAIVVRVSGGKIVRIPTARVHLDWGANSQDVEVGVMRNLPADVLLGNDLGNLASSFVAEFSSVYPVTT